MMRHALIVVAIFITLSALGQEGEIVVHDFTKIMVEVEGDGSFHPVSSLNSTKSAGFFLHAGLEGSIRICHDQALSIWINGRLLEEMTGCKVYDAEDLFRRAKSDSLYIAFFSTKKLSNLTCEQILDRELVVVKDDPKVLRVTTNEFRDFNITAILTLLFLFGFFGIRSPPRLNYLLRRTFSFKVSAYEFVNTDFLSQAGALLSIMLSLLAGLMITSGDYLLNPNPEGTQLHFKFFIYSWLKSGFLILILLFSKWIIVSVVSKLFKFRKINDQQLFDFINFCSVCCFLIFLLIIVDFVLGISIAGVLLRYVEITFSLILLGFVAWFTLKFVNNSPRRKLLIISYLCATEIIPALIVFGWFFK